MRRPVDDWCTDGVCYCYRVVRKSRPIDTSYKQMCEYETMTSQRDPHRVCYGLAPWPWKRYLSTSNLSWLEVLQISGVQSRRFRFRDTIHNVIHNRISGS